MKDAVNEIKMVDLYGQYLEIQDEVNQSIQKVIEDSTFINGPAVKQFSSALQNFLKVNHIITCANGTDALQIALMALDIDKGAEIIIPSFSFAAPAEVVALLGYIPVFADCDPQLYNVTVESIEKCITSKTRAIIAVHLFGLAAPMHEISKLAKKHQLYLIEDNAQSLGATCEIGDTTTKAGTIGDFGTTSFFPSKNLGCMGDGGALFTNDARLAEKALMIANHGQLKKYTHQVIGINSRLDSLQAAVLNVKIKYLDQYNKRRFEAADSYYSLLKNQMNILLPELPNLRHVYNQFTIRVQEEIRDQLIDYLSANGIPTMVYYPRPLHLQPVFKYLNYQIGDLPVSEMLSKEVLSLPMHSQLSLNQLTYITSHLKIGIESLQNKKVLSKL